MLSRATHAPRPLPRSRARGVTLVELMVALAIFVLTLVALLPDAIGWVQGIGVRNVAESIRSGIEKARLEALRRNADMSFWLVSSGEDKPLDNGCEISSAGVSWVISVADPSGNCLAAPSTTVQPLLVERWSGTEGGYKIRVSAEDGVGNAASSVTFNQLGQVRTTGSQVAIIDVTHSTASGARRLRVQVLAGGAVRMCDRDVAAGDPRAC